MWGSVETAVLRHSKAWPDTSPCRMLWTVRPRAALKLGTDDGTQCRALFLRAVACHDGAVLSSPTYPTPHQPPT